MAVRTSSILRASSKAPFGCERPIEERLAALALPISAERGELPSRAVRAELWVGEIRDALMPRGPVCPSCRGSAIVRYGKRRGVQRYKCKECRSYFTDLTGFALHRVRRRDLWLDFCQCMVEGLSVRQTARSLGISKNTAFAWRHRVIAALASADSHIPCSGIVEVVHHPLVRSFKGSQVPNGARLDDLDWIVRRYRSAYRHALPPARLGGFLLAVDREGRARARVTMHGESLAGALRRIASYDADICAYRSYSSLAAPMDWPDRVNWVGGRRGRLKARDRLDPGPLYHARNVRGLLHKFRDWMRPFRGVATRYLLRYFSWYLRASACAAVRPGAAARFLFFEALQASVHPEPG